MLIVENCWSASPFSCLARALNSETPYVFCSKWGPNMNIYDAIYQLFQAVISGKLCIKYIGTVNHFCMFRRCDVTTETIHNLV